jgi:hypothetical protein
MSSHCGHTDEVARDFMDTFWDPADSTYRSTLRHLLFEEGGGGDLRPEFVCWKHVGIII